MPRRHRLFVIVLTVVLAGAPAVAHADEADNFTCRARAMKDSLGAIDALMNEAIAAVVARANQRGALRCDAACIVRELQAGVGGSYHHPRTWVPHARFAKRVRESALVERCHLKFRDTIYGARAYDKPWLYPFTGRIIFVADSIRLSGRMVGLDKIEHFIREGLEHWRFVAQPGGDIAASIAREAGPPRRQFAWTEHGLKGLSLTGVFAYADLAAGYAGFRFWNDLLSIGSPESYISRDAATGRYAVQRPFTFAAYVTDAWDEAINCSTFDARLAADVALALRQRTATCPVAEPASLAQLPDARLYVNPALLPALR